MTLKRYILTGAPGSGKTAILRALEADGHTVVEEAATDRIALEQAEGRAEPWTDPQFPVRVCRLQYQRQTTAAVRDDGVQFFDRSPICTYALARYLGHPVEARLALELDRIEAEHVYERRVCFVRLLGFVTPTAARRIDLAAAEAFERVHLEAYRSFGYECVEIPPGDLHERASAVKRLAGLR